jgi:hypothetical protein
VVSEEPEAETSAAIAAAPSSDSETTDPGEEFDETLEQLRVPVSLQATRRKKQTQQKKSRRRSGESSESEDREGDVEDSDSETQRSRKKIRTKKKTNVESAPRVWSDNEDTMLRELYGLYAGSHSVFDVIALNTSFM